ncbi:MAG: porin [Betaproteobacteria bacterium]|nr:MAG: porin [Betaproteobacteria bacterium]
MHKKIIALAVAGLAAAPAFAQSSVAVYGLIDMGFSHRSDNLVSGVKSRSAIDSGMANGSRLGFRGTEDLGNGVKLNFVLEQGMGVDTGASNQGGRTFGRQSFVSLSSGFGTLALGRTYTPQNVLQATIDPFGDGTVGKISNVYAGNDRVDNAVFYTTPNFSGLSVALVYSGNTGVTAANENVGNKGDQRFWAIAPTYVNGPLTVGANVHRQKAHDVDDARTEKVWDLGASYDFGVVKLAAMVGQRKDGSVADLGTLKIHDDAKFWMVGASAPVFTSGKVVASYVHARDDRDAGEDWKASKWALGYVHTLSKRTNIYAAYASIDNNDASSYGTSDALNLGRTLVASQGDRTAYQKGFNLGIRHSF